MKYKNKKKERDGHIPYSLCLLLSFGFALISCEGEAELTALDVLSAEMDGDVTYYVQEASAVTFNGSSGSNTSYTGIPVRLSENTAMTDTIDAFVDVSLVSAYNELYDENNLTLPEGAFAVSHNGRFPVAANSRQSLDSLHVELVDPSQLETNRIYLVPVRLQARSGADLDYSVVFLKVEVTITSLTARMTTGTTVFRNTRAFNFGPGIPMLNYTNFFNDATGRFWGGPSQVSFAVGLNYSFPYDVQVEVVADPTDRFYATYNTYAGYLAFPTTMYELVKNTATVPANSLVSSDSITVSLRNDFPQAIYYMLALRVTANPSSPDYVPAVSTTDSSKAYIAIRRLIPSVL